MTASRQHRATTVCRHTVSGSISLPSLGFFSPFPHGTSALSVVREYLALEDGPPGFPRGFTCPTVLESPSQEAGVRFVYGPITLYGPAFQPFRLRIRFVTSRRFRKTARTGLATPGLQRLRAWHKPGLGCSRFARHYSGNRDCFLFLRVLRCFTSPRSPPAPMYSVPDPAGLPRGVSPFGDLRVKAC